MAIATCFRPAVSSSHRVTGPLKEAKNPKEDEDAFVPEQLNELVEEGWKPWVCRSSTET
jgi:hypothetical protein